MEEVVEGVVVDGGDGFFGSETILYSPLVLLSEEREELGRDESRVLDPISKCKGSSDGLVRKRVPLVRDCVTTALEDTLNIDGGHC